MNIKSVFQKLEELQYTNVEVRVKTRQMEINGTVRRYPAILIRATIPETEQT